MPAPPAFGKLQLPEAEKNAPLVDLQQINAEYEERQGAVRHRDVAAVIRNGIGTHLHTVSSRTNQNKLYLYFIINPHKSKYTVQFFYIISKLIFALLLIHILIHIQLGRLIKKSFAGSCDAPSVD